MPAKPKPSYVNLDHLLPIHLQPKQQHLYEMLEATGMQVPTVIGWGGSKGGGKSAGIRRLMLSRRLAHPGTVGVIVRRVFEDIKDNHIEPFFRDFPSLQQLYKTVPKDLTLPNDSVIQFRFAETMDDVVRKFNGKEYYDVMVDQAEQFIAGELRMLTLAARWPGVEPGSAKISLYFNPGPGAVGLGELRRIFFTKRYLPLERPGNYHFIQAYGWDNYEWFRNQVDLEESEFYTLSSEERFEMFITRTSQGRTLNSLPKGERDAYLLGTFDNFSGQFFGEAWDDKLCVI